MKTKAYLLKEIKEAGFPVNDVAISIDDFFDNPNYSANCIGINIYPNRPEPEKFYQIFKELISSKKADKIFVKISDIDDPEDWFFSDTIYIISNLSIDELKKNVQQLLPDEIFEGWMQKKPINVQDIKSGMKIYSLLWD